MINRFGRFALALFSLCVSYRLIAKEPRPGAILPGSSEKEGIVTCEDDRFTGEKFCEFSPVTVSSGSGNPWILVGAAISRTGSGATKAWLVLNYIGTDGVRRLRSDHTLYLLVAGERQPPVSGTYDDGTFGRTFNSERSVFRLDPKSLGGLPKVHNVELRWGEIAFPFTLRLSRAVQDLTTQIP